MVGVPRGHGGYIPALFVKCFVCIVSFGESDENVHDERDKKQGNGEMKFLIHREELAFFYFRIFRPGLG